MSNKDQDEEDVAAWKRYVEEVRPLAHEKQLRYVKKSLFISSTTIFKQRRHEYYERHHQSFTPDSASICKKMRVARIAVEGQIDLHGLTLKQAMHNLQVFLMNAQIQGKIWVLVITGKGRPEEKTLRNQVPQWLDQLPYISGYAPAKPLHGGTGALYVRLKKAIF